MKNMNSFKAITRAIDYEASRQIDVIEDGGKIDQETLRWDDVSGRTFSMRDKEDAQDYRYFPDPDLVAIKLSEEYIENIKNNLPELPESRKKRYMEEYGLSEKIVTYLQLLNIYQIFLKVLKRFVKMLKQLQIGYYQTFQKYLMKQKQSQYKYHLMQINLQN